MSQYATRNDDKRLRNIFLLVALISTSLFLFISILGITDEVAITIRDYRLASFLYGLRTPARTEVAIAVTRLADFSGQMITTILVTLFLLFLKKWRTGIWYGLTVLLGAGFLNGFAKNFFQRIRPDQIEHLVDQGGYAFPSGHSMGSMIIYGGVAFLLIRYINTKKKQQTMGKLLLSLIIGIIILAIGLSRVYLGVHYPSDVLGGFALGLAWLSLSIAAWGLPFTKKELQARNQSHFKSL